MRWVSRWLNNAIAVADSTKGAHNEKVEKFVVANQPLGKVRRKYSPELKKFMAIVEVSWWSIRRWIDSYQTLSVRLIQ